MQFTKRSSSARSAALIVRSMPTLCSCSTGRGFDALLHCYQNAVSYGTITAYLCSFRSSSLLFTLFTLFAIALILFTLRSLAIGFFALRFLTVRLLAFGLLAFGLLAFSLLAFGLLCVLLLLGNQRSGTIGERFALLEVFVDCRWRRRYNRTRDRDDDGE
jgi:hypothetical protein